ncbi:MAG: MATE family efflux transporter [Chloroflexota bacterium]
MNVSVKGAVVARDWTKGNVLRNLLALSWPVVVSNSLNMLGPTVDMIWVGRLGAAAIAGVGVAGIVVMVVNSMLMGLFTSLRAMVARFIGAKDARSAVHVTRQAFVISAAFSLLTAIIGIFLAEPILRLTGVDADVVAEGAPYLRINFIGMVAMSFRMISDGVMQASGDTMTPMKIAFVFRVFHVVLCPFLVFGWWLFPRLGVSGAALTLVISQSLGTALGLWVLLSGRSRLRLNFSNFHLDPVMIWRLVKIGFPASIMGMERSFGQLVIMWFMVPFGTLAVAAHTLGQRIEMALFFPAMGLGLAAGVLGGQNLGARQPKQAMRTGWLAIALVEAFMVTCALAILLWAEGIISVFSPQAELVDLGGDFIRIAAVGYLVLGIMAVLSQFISGVGDTWPPMLVSMAAMWLVQVPLAFFLPGMNGLGAYGVRWAIVAGTVIAAIVFLVYFRLGRWQRKKV